MDKILYALMFVVLTHGFSLCIVYMHVTGYGLYMSLFLAAILAVILWAYKTDRKNQLKKNKA
jgi:hypothetical protein